MEKKWSNKYHMIMFCISICRGNVVETKICGEKLDASTKE
jgi:hypothetical protein